MRSFLLRLRRRLRKNHALYRFLGWFYGLRCNVPLVFARCLRGYDDNMVVFSAFDCRSYSDNSRYVSEKLHELRPETDIVWLFSDVEAARKQYPIPDYVRALRAFSVEGMAAMGRARVVVDNFNKKFYLNFPGKGQFYVQLWHGDRGFKKVGFDNPSVNFRMLEEFGSLGVVGSDFGERLFHTAFHFRGELMKVGSPRNDILLRNDPAERSAIRARLGLDEDTRVLLYAPTYRDSELRGLKPHQVPLNLDHVLDTLERTTGARWKCLTRSHYYSGGIAAGETSDRLISATEYPEMAELLLIADALLSDYSSCAGDYALTHRPIFLYQEDTAQYSQETRELYFRMEDTGYLVASTPEELDRLIEQTTPERARENCEAVLGFYGAAETGHATESVAYYIIDKLQSQEKQ